MQHWSTRDFDDWEIPVGDLVKFIDGPLRNRKEYVADYRQPYMAHKAEKLVWAAMDDDPIIPAGKIVVYEWTAQVKTLYRDGSASKIIYEMKVKK